MCTLRTSVWRLSFRQPAECLQRWEQSLLVFCSFRLEQTAPEGSVEAFCPQLCCNVICTTTLHNIKVCSERLKVNKRGCSDSSYLSCK